MKTGPHLLATPYQKPELKVSCSMISLKTENSYQTASDSKSILLTVKDA